MAQSEGARDDTLVSIEPELHLQAGAGSPSSGLQIRLARVEEAVDRLEAAIGRLEPKISEMAGAFPHLATKAEIAGMVAELPHLATKAELGKRPTVGGIIAIVAVIAAIASIPIWPEWGAAFKAIVTVH